MFIQIIERAKGVHPQMLTRFKFHLSPPKKGTLIMLHGYTSGSWQVKPMMDHFHKKGYNVVTPRLLGHGLISNIREDLSQLPKSNQSHHFEDFSETLYTFSKCFPGPVHFIGFSGGGVLTTYIGLKHPETTSLTLISPFYRPSDRLGQFVFSFLRWASKKTALPIDRILDFISWKLAHENTALVNHHPNYISTLLGHFYALSSFGATVSQLAVDSPLQVPCLFITTACDTRSDQSATDTIASTCRNYTKRHHFSSDQKVPHAMLHPDQNPNTESIDTLYKLIEQHLQLFSS